MINGKTVSLCMVVYNSADLCERAITSVRSIIDEVVIVDQGSSASDSERLKALADVYLRTTNKGNADYDRQYCYALATKDYILALDADECFEQSELDKLPQVFEYDFHVAWFLFKNLVVHEDLEVNIKDILGGDDPHPRLWKREIDFQGKRQMPVMWPQQAHKFPAILSEKQIFLDIFVKHRRELKSIIATHLHRGKAIDPQAQALEKNFVRAVLGKFDFKVKSAMTTEFPELKHYLKG